MKTNPYPGLFITFEGLDGAGKSTQAGLLAAHLKNRAKEGVFATSEPTQFLPGGLVRSRLLGDWMCSSDCLQLLFASDRGHHLEKEIIPRLKKGESVICDRYAFSSFAYGGIESDPDWLMDVNSRFILPDLTIFLEVSAKDCVQRLAKQGRSIELFEKQDKLEKVQTNYHAIIERFRMADADIVVFDGSQPVESVAKEVNAAVLKKIRSK